MGSITDKTCASVLALVTVATLSGCGSGSSAAARGAPNALAQSVGQPAFKADVECGTYDGEGCAPEADRVDIDRPTFSHPTEITNPLFPISALESAVLLGEVDGKPFRSETTLLPATGTVLLDGEAVERHIVVGRFDDPIAVRPHRALVIEGVAVGIGITRLI